MKLIYGLILLTALNVNIFANIKIGSGMSSTTSGRAIPGAYFGIDSENWGGSLFATGFKNTLSYTSSYQTNAFYLINKNFLQVGIGLGLYYYEIGFKKDLDTSTDKNRNIAFGPAIRSMMNFGFIFIGVEAMYGLRPNHIVNHLLLSTQDYVALLSGFYF